MMTREIEAALDAHYDGLAKRLDRAIADGIARALQKATTGSTLRKLERVAPVLKAPPEAPQWMRNHAAQLREAGRHDPWLQKRAAQVEADAEAVREIMKVHAAGPQRTMPRSAPGPDRREAIRADLRTAVVMGDTVGVVALKRELEVEEMKLALRPERARPFLP